MQQSRDRELAERLADLSAPEYEDDFFADLWLRIASEYDAASPPRRSTRPRRHRLRWAVGATVLAAVAAVALVTTTVPGVAATLHLPLGQKVASLEDQNLQLRHAFLGQLSRGLATTAHVVAVDGGSVLSATTPAERLVARNPQIQELVREYYATQVLARSPGSAGARGRRELARYFRPGASALARARYEALGTRGELAVGPDGAAAIDPTRASIAVIHDLAVDSSGMHATAVVWPVAEYQVWFDSVGRLQCGYVGGASGESWGAAPGGAPHRLQLVKQADGWLIADDFSLDPEVPAALRRGGAPAAVWRSEKRRIDAASQRRHEVPSGVRTTLEQLVALLNQRRFSETGKLFADGVGLTPAAFQHPSGAWRLQLVSAWGYDPLSRRAIADPGRTSVAVRIDGPRDLLVAGGGTLSGLWMFRRDASGQWQITGRGAAETGAPNPM